MIENINLFGGIIVAAETIALIQEKSEEQRTEEEKDKLKQLYILKNNNDELNMALAFSW